MLSALGIFVAPIGALVAFSLGLTAWRYQLLNKRRYEVAEQVLQAVANAVTALHVARSPLSYVGEGSTRQPEPGESADVKRRRDANYVPIERLNKHSDVFTELRRAKILAETHFGDGAGKPIVDLFSIRYDIVIHSEELMHAVGDHGSERTEDERKFFVNARRIMFGTERDDTGKEIEKAFSQIKSTCGAYLRPDLLCMLLHTSNTEPARFALSRLHSKVTALWRRASDQERAG